MKLVLDTTMMVAAVRSDSGASRQLLRRALEGRDVELLVSVPLMIEYEAVMTRLEHLKAARLSRHDIGALLDAVAAVAQPVELAFLWRPMLPDADDDMVLETAVNGRADALVTFNRRHFVMAQRQFGTVLLRPGEVLTRLEKQN